MDTFTTAEKYGYRVIAGDYDAVIAMEQAHQSAIKDKKNLDVKEHNVKNEAFAGDPESMYLKWDANIVNGEQRIDAGIFNLRNNTIV